MIDFSDYTSQLQVAHWGWTIAVFLWLVGLSGMGFFLNYWVRSKALVYLCTVAGIVGTLLVVSHLSRMLNLPMAVINSLLSWDFNFGSWMLLGICLLGCLCVFSLFYSMIYAGVLFTSNTFKGLLDNSVFCGLFAFLGVACTIYSGFLLTQAVGISLWNTALIPLLWIMSGMASAIGSIELMMVFKMIPAEKVAWSRRTAFWVEVAELFTIFAFIHVAISSAVVGARVGAESLVSGPQSVMFWVGVIVLGSVIPLLLNLLTRNHKVLAVSAVLGICGALLLRASILFAGYYDPTFM